MNRLTPLINEAHSKPLSSWLFEYDTPTAFTQAELDGFREAVGMVAGDELQRCWQRLERFVGHFCMGRWYYTWSFRAIENINSVEDSGEIFDVEDLQEFLFYHARQVEPED